MEQKKAFLEDGGGFDRIWNGTVNFLKRLRKTRFAQIAGLVLIFLFTVNSVFGVTVRQIHYNIVLIDLRRHLQSELNIAQSAGVSADRLDEINNILTEITLYGSWHDDLFDTYLEKFGEYPFSPRERQLLQECAVLCGRLEEAAFDSSSMSWCFALMLGLWMSCGKDRKIRYPLLAILAGYLVGHIPALLYWAYLAQDAAKAVHAICPLVFSSGVWPLPPESGILAQICTPDVFAGIWQEVMRGLGKNFLSIMDDIVFFALFIGVVICIEKLIDKIKAKKNKTEEST